MQLTPPIPASIHSWFPTTLSRSPVVIIHQTLISTTTKTTHENQIKIEKSSTKPTTIPNSPLISNSQHPYHKIHTILRKNPNFQPYQRNSTNPRSQIIQNTHKHNFKFKKEQIFTHINTDITTNESNRKKSTYTAKKTTKLQLYHNSLTSI